jgi:hypothetical protein
MLSLLIFYFLFLFDMMQSKNKNKTFECVKRIIGASSANLVSQKSLLDGQSDI